MHISSCRTEPIPENYILFSSPHGILFYLLLYFQVMNHQEQTITLAFASNQKYTEMAILVLNYLKNTLNIDEDEYFKIEISAREAINNAIVHGNRLDMSKRVTVRYLWEHHRLRIEVLDENYEQTNFNQIQDKINSCSLLSFSGRGITIMRNYMDVFEFNCTDRGNMIILEKNLP